MRNRDRSGFLRKQALDTLNPLLPPMRGKWRGRGTVGAFGRCHNRLNYQPVTDPRFNHALRPAHVERAAARRTRATMLGNHQARLDRFAKAA